MDIGDIFSMFNDIFGGGGGVGGRARVARGGVARGYDLETQSNSPLRSRHRH
jgi:hypothetical protein